MKVPTLKTLPIDAASLALAPVLPRRRSSTAVIPNGMPHQFTEVQGLRAVADGPMDERGRARRIRRAPAPSLLEDVVTCRELSAFILDYLEGTLDPEVRARFSHHLTLCPSCVNYLSAYQATVALGRDAFDDDQRSVPQAGVPEILVRSILSATRGAVPSA